MSLRGWYAYAFAAEPFVVSAVATYVPLLLEELARENAVWIGDHVTPCLTIGDQPGLMPVPIAPPKCVIRLGWAWIDTSSLPLYTFSLSVLVQMMLVVSISGVADRGAHRKLLLISFAVVGSICTITLGRVGKHNYYAASLLAVIGNASFGAVTVCGNAFLPRIVAAESRRLVRLQKTAVDRFQGAVQTSNSPAQAPQASPRPAAGQEIRHEQSRQSLHRRYDGSNVDGTGDGLSIDEAARLSARISGTGTAIGYMAALLVQVATMLMLVEGGVKRESNTKRLRLVISLIGWWWLVGQIPVAWWLQSKVGEDDEPDVILDEDDRPAFSAQIAEGWKMLYYTIQRVWQLKDIATFLVGWFLLSDAITTINSTAILFARANLQMATPQLAMIGLLTVLFAIAGSLLFGRRKNQKSSLVSVALIGAVIPLYGIIGFFQPWIGLKHAWEVDVLAAWYGIALGALNATTRSLYAILIPPGHEVMFFALYSVTDKGSSVIGPTITGLITDYTHNIRYTFYFLFGMMLLAAYVFTKVDFDQGHQEALEYEDEIIDAEYLPLRMDASAQL